ncbi:MAG: iron chaperone [Catenulispora sp.]
MPKTETFTAQEKAAMRERVRETKARGKVSLEEAEAEVLAKIAEFGDADRALAEKVHAIVRENAPELMPRLWYGQPAYAKDGKVLCFFQPSGKFKTRYCTLGFTDVAALDDGNMWPTAFALTKLTAADEKRIAALVTQAAA